jgi:hypothetical protein
MASFFEKIVKLIANFLVKAELLLRLADILP